MNRRVRMFILEKLVIRMLDCRGWLLFCFSISPGCKVEKLVTNRKSLGVIFRLVLASLRLLLVHHRDRIICRDFLMDISKLVFLSRVVNMDRLVNMFRCSLAMS